MTSKRPRAILVAAIAAALALPLAAAPAKRAATIADLHAVQGVGEPVIAPDGKSLAFTVTSTDLPP
jgi:hypothetical protein